MNGNYYAFDFFEELSKGKLNNQFISKLNRNELLNQISQKNDECVIFTVVQFVKRKGSLKIESRFDIPNSHPLALEFTDNQFSLFPIESENVNECIDLLNILSENLVGIEYKKIKNKIQYNFKHLSNWNSMEEYQLQSHFYYSIIQEQKNAVIKTIKNKIINLFDIKAVSDFFRILLKELDLICVEILRKHKLEIDSIKYEIKDLFENLDLIKLIYLSLDEIHSFVEERFNSHSNDNRIITNASTKLKGIELTDKSKQIKDFFLTTKIKKELREIIFIPFYEFELKESKNEISDDFFSFYSFFIYQMEEFISKNVNPNLITEDMIIDFLFELNFNYYVFVDYITSKIIFSLKKEKDDSQKKIILLTYLKRFQQKQIRTKKKYCLLDPSIRQLTTQWIEYELSFFKRLINVQLDNSGANSKIERKKKSSKIKTNLSVNEAALLIRLFKTAGAFQEDNLNKINIAFTESFLTSSQKDISLKSFRNKVYNPTSDSIQNMEEFLLNLVEINRNL